MHEMVYANRELSWLKFNERVLEEAARKDVPLAERLSFLSIYQSNLDEFFRVRVGTHVDQMHSDQEIRDNKTNMTSAEQIQCIFAAVHRLNTRKDEIFTELMMELEDAGVRVVDFHTIDEEESRHLEGFFDREVAPLLSPIVVDKRQPFPFLRNQEIYAAAVLKKPNKKKERVGIVACSSSALPRLVQVSERPKTYMLSEELILHFISKIFSNYEIKAKSLLRVSRNADIDADALYDEDLDYREFMSGLMKKAPPSGADSSGNEPRFGQTHCQAAVQASGNRGIRRIQKQYAAGSVVSVHAAKHPARQQRAVLSASLPASARKHTAADSGAGSGARE